MIYNLHNEKYQMKDIGGIKKEQFREYSDSTKYRNYVDSSLTENNLYKDMTADGCDWYKQIREAKILCEEKTGRAVRKDAVVLCSTVESVPATWDNDACKEYFQAKAEWFGKYLHERGGADKECLKSLAVHLDESTPHATYAWIPIKDDKLQAKNILNREFLRDLQSDSQNFTFNWIDRWNERHPERQLEKLEAYIPDSRRVHLSEAEYKEQKIMQNVETMNQALETVKEEIGDLKAEKQDLSEKTLAAEAAKETYENKFIELTEAPDIESYEHLEAENISLKEELSLKDKMIERLQEANTVLQEKFDEWKEKFSNIAHNLGDRLLNSLGYDSPDKNLPEYPSSEFADSYKSLQAGVSDINPKKLYTLPDLEHEGKFRVAVYDNHGEYNTIRDDFDTRLDADNWKQSLSEGIKNISESKDIEMDNHTLKL